MYGVARGGSTSMPIARERVDHEVAAAVVDLRHLLREGRAVGQRGDAGQLQGVEHARVEVGLELAVALHDLGVAAAIQPTRQPVMFQPFESEKISTPTSFAPGVARKLGAA